MALQDGAIVQPHYIVSDKRASLGHERAAMDAIRNEIARCLGASVAQRLLATIETPLDDIVVAQDIKDSFVELAERGTFGSQYPWLVAYARSLHDTVIEIGIEAPHGRETLICRTVGEAMAAQKAHIPAGPFADGTGAAVFSIFDFPIRALDKHDARRIAAERGWTSIMNRTHFCHRPRRSGEPCGRCGACVGTTNEGMGYRIPRRVRLQNWLRSISRRGVA
ncbi:7-cyano-7-deazaguanine synthase [Shimia ponticola]|uniref:7-cyano-7-deazaguanine synthase n=1 Tax=Shimia ponticola TaxID=2582893 RepID=UPI00164A7293|nr:7-cyano-7-deazaguanine synthase [Shimia ponticola]